jgi:hypothetical protein
MATIHVIADRLNLSTVPAYLANTWTANSTEYKLYSGLNTF